MSLHLAKLNWFPIGLKVLFGFGVFLAEAQSCRAWWRWLALVVWPRTCSRWHEQSTQQGTDVSKCWVGTTEMLNEAHKKCLVHQGLGIMRWTCRHANFKTFRAWHEHSPGNSALECMCGGEEECNDAWKGVIFTFSACLFTPFVLCSSWEGIS